jgi:hypothetical protein
LGLLDLLPWSSARDVRPATAAEARRHLTVVTPDDADKTPPPRELDGEVQVARIARGYAAITDHLPPASEAMAEEGADVFRRMERDAEVSASLFQIYRRIVGRAAEWLPPEGMEGEPLAVAAAEHVRDCLRTEVNLREASSWLLRAVTRRFTVLQVVWRVDAEGAYGAPGARVPAYLRAERTEDYDVARDGTLVALRAGRPGGLPLTPPSGPYDCKFITHVNAAEPDLPAGVSVLEGVYWEWKFLRAGMGFWLDLLDRFGLPSLAALFDSASDDPKKAAEMAKVIASSLAQIAGGRPGALAAKALIVPNTGGRGDDFERFQTWLEKRIRKGILSTTLTVDIADVGARAQGEVSEREVDGVARWYGDALEETLTRTLGRWCTVKRFGPDAARYAPRCRLDWREPAPFEQWLQAAEAGFEVSREAGYTVYNLPRPANLEGSEETDPADVFTAVPSAPAPQDGAPGRTGTPAQPEPNGPAGDFADVPFGPRTPRPSRTPTSAPRRRS